MNKYYSPITNTELIRLKNGYYKSSDDMFYYRIVNGTPVALIDKNNGGPLVPNNNGTFTSLYTGENNFYLINGEIVELKDPNNCGPLYPNGDGTFTSVYSHELFHYDSNKNILIPLYIEIPEICDECAVVEGNRMIGEETGKKYIIKESAHIEGQELVGDTTGRRFVIGDKGIIIPDEYGNYHFDYSDTYTRYIPKRMVEGMTTFTDRTEEVDAVIEKIISEGAKENGISLPLVKYLTYLKEDINRIEEVDAKLLIQIMNGEKIDAATLMTRLESLKQKEPEGKEKV